MARAPEDRYASADALADAIDALPGVRREVDSTDGTVHLGERVRGLPMGRTFPPRAWIPWAWVFGLTAALCLGVGIAVWKTDLRRKEPTTTAQTTPQSPVRPPTHQQAGPASPGPTPAAPGPPLGPSHPPRPAPPEGVRFEVPLEAPSIAAPLDPDPKTTEPPPVVPALPTTALPATDPDAGQPAEARESLRAAAEALSVALAMPLAERAAEWRARLGQALSLAEAASAQAPSWPKPKRLRADVLFTLGRYGEASKAYAKYVPPGSPQVLPAEGLLAEFLDWFRGARPWAEEVTPTASKAGLALADRLAAAATAADLEVSPFLPWRPGSGVDKTAGLEGARADLATMASLARMDWERAREEGQAAAKKGGGVASYVAELMSWLMVELRVPDALLVELVDRRVRTPEVWLLASWGLSWTADLDSAGQAATRAVEAREAREAETGHQVGLVAYRKGDYDRARQEWAAAQALDPTRRTYLVDLGAICLLRGEFTEAGKRLGDALLKKTHPDAPTNRLYGFAEYEIACVNARRIAEVTPRPKKAERAKFAANAVNRVQRCLTEMDKLPRDKDVTATEAPRTYYEWTANNVRHWIAVDPWVEGLRSHPSTWKQIEALLK